MNRAGSSQSGVFTLRVLFAFSLCSIGVLLTMISLMASPYREIDNGAALPDRGTPKGTGAFITTVGSWEIVPSPNGSALEDNVLYSVSCVSDSDCWAVGYYGDNPSFPQTLIEKWDGSAWSIVGSPSNNPGGNYLSGVTCSSASDCWAVGTYYPSGGDGQTLAEHWDGVSWSIVASPNASPGDNRLLNVTCLSPSDCWAVGDHEDLSSPPRRTAQTLVEHWDGNAWTIVPSPSTAPMSNNSLNGVACVSASDCWAVGYHVGKFHEQTLVEHWDGKEWTIVVSPNGNSSGQESDNVLQSVTCPSASDCWAVGNYYGSGFSTLVEHWDGSTWSIVSSPNRNGPSFLTGVTCNSASRCWAVGLFENADPETIIEKWDGNSWALVDAPNPTDHNPLWGVTCASGSQCWAVGYHDSTTTKQTLIERFMIDSPVVSSVVSRRVHGTAGTFDINLPQTGNPGIECRFGGSTGNYQMVFTFGTELASVGNVSTSTGSVSSSSIGPNPNQYVVNLTGIPNAQYITVTLDTVQDVEGGTGSAAATMGVLIGDASGNGVINSTDLSQTKARVGQPITTSTFRSDIQSNGSINAADISLVKLNMGSSLP